MTNLSSISKFTWLYPQQFTLIGGPSLFFVINSLFFSKKKQISRGGSRRVRWSSILCFFVFFSVFCFVFVFVPVILFRFCFCSGKEDPKDIRPESLVCPLLWFFPGILYFVFFVFCFFSVFFFVFVFVPVILFRFCFCSGKEPVRIKG